MSRYDASLGGYPPSPARTSPGPVLRAVRALLVMGALLAVMWLLEAADTLAGNRLDAFGIAPRQLDRLPEIFTAPFLHVGFAHLAANSIPLFVLGFLAALGGLGRFAALTLIVIVVSGLGVWLVAPPHTVTLGASGLVFGYFGYLLARGVVTRRLLDIFVAVVVVVVYGLTLVSGLVPGNSGVSWQGHLFGLVGGLLAAGALHRRTSRA